MDLGLTGRTALVLGGNRGMGLAVAHALAREGADVAIAARDPAALETARGALAAHGGKVAAFTLNLSDTAQLPHFAAEVARSFAAPDILINNTGGPPYGGAIGRASADWATSFQDMTLSVITLTDAFLPAMRARGWGRIITIVSSGAMQPIPVLGISNTLRAALVSWSKTISNDIAPDGVTANILVPGRIETDRVRLTDEAIAAREGLSVEAVRARSFATIPMGRYGRPEEIADMVAFLASERAGYITGAAIRVDGGIIRHT